MAVSIDGREKGSYLTDEVPTEYWKVPLYQRLTSDEGNKLTLGVLDGRTLNDG